MEEKEKKDGNIDYEAYNAELRKLKSAYEERFRSICGDSKAKMMTIYSDIMGEEYVEAYSKAHSLASQYKEYVNEAFEYAAQYEEGLALVNEISLFADKPVDDKDKAEKVRLLLDRIMDVLENEYPDLVSLIKRTQQEMRENEAFLADLMARNESDLSDGRKTVKEFFKNQLEKMIYSFADELSSLRKKYGMGSNAKSVETELSEDFARREDDLDESFFYPSGKKGTLN